MIRFTISIPSELNDWLKTQAKHYNRSKSQHIAFLLQAIRETAEQNQERLSKVAMDEIDVLFPGLDKEITTGFPDLGNDNESDQNP